MSEESIISIRRHILAIHDAIKEEEEKTAQSKLALECIEQIMLRTRKYLTDDARTDALQNVTGLLAVGQGQVLSNQAEREGPLSLRHDNGNITKEDIEMPLASRTMQSPDISPAAGISFNFTATVDIDDMTLLRSLFGCELMQLKVKPLGSSVTKSLDYTENQAEELTNLVFYDILNTPMKHRVMNIIQLYANGNRASVGQSEVSLQTRSSLPLPLREFSILYETRGIIRASHSILHHIKKNLCEVLLFRQYQAIQSSVANEDPGMLATFAENDFRPQVKSCKAFVAHLFDINPTTFDHDITQCQILAELCDAFGYGIILFLPKGAGQSLARNYRCPRLNAAWPILKNMLPDLERIANMACQNILNSIAKNERVRIAVPNGDTNSVESLFSPFFDFTRYLEEESNELEPEPEPEDELTEESIRSFVLEGIKVVEYNAEPVPMEV